MDDDEFRGKRNGFFKSNLFIFLLGQFAMFAFWLLGFAVTYGENQQKERENSQWRANIEQLIHRFDDQGSSYAHYMIQANTNQINFNSARIERLDQQIKDLPVLQERVNRIDEWNKRQPQHSP